MLVRICNQCGKHNVSDSQFCVRCGQNITGEAVREVADTSDELPGPVKGRSSSSTARIMRSNGVITDIQIPLSSVIVLVFKFFLASIPAIVLTTVLVYVLIGALKAATILGVLGTLFSQLKVHWNIK